MDASEPGKETRIRVRLIDSFQLADIASLKDYQ